MNFLSHYYTLKKSENAYVVLGSILPDLVTDFSKIYNQSIEEQFYPKEFFLKQMLEGVQLHIKADDLFHNSKKFSELENVAKELLKKEFGTTLKRKYVIAHVLVELVIDKYLILKEEALLDQFYNTLKEIKTKKANLFFESLYIEEDSSNFLRNFSYFLKNKFLFVLKENEGIIFTLNKVFAKKLNYEFLKEEDKWKNLITKLYLEIENKIPILLEDVKTKLYEK